MNFNPFIKSSSELGVNECGSSRVWGPNSKVGHLGVRDLVTSTLNLLAYTVIFNELNNNINQFSGNFIHRSAIVRLIAGLNLNLKY